MNVAQPDDKEEEEEDEGEEEEEEASLRSASLFPMQFMSIARFPWFAFLLACLLFFVFLPLQTMMPYVCGHVLRKNGRTRSGNDGVA